MSSQASNRDLYFRLLGYVKPHWKAFALAVLAMVGTAATEPIFPAIMKYLLDKGFQAPDQRLVWAIPMGILLLFTARGVLSFVTNYLMTWISTRLVADLRREMYSRLLVQPTQVFHEQSAGGLISRLLYDAENVNQAATNVLVTAFRESLTALALLFYLFYLDWQLTLITLAIAPLIAGIVKGFSRRMRKASRSSLEALHIISHTIEEAVNAHKVIKIYGGQAQEKERFLRDTERFRRSMMREAVPASAITPITHIAAAIAVAIITFLALNQSTGQASTSAGGFISFIAAMLLLISPIKQLTSISPLMQRGLAACESVFGLIDSPGEEDSGSNVLQHTKGMIEFNHVSFSYPGTDRPALVDISFQALQGKPSH